MRPTPEEGLDPRDWDAFAALAHRMLDETLDGLRGLSQRPAWQPVPGGIAGQIRDEPLPRSPQGEEAAYEDFRRLVEPYPNGNRGPRFYGWVQGNGFPYASMAEFLATSLNPHMAGFHQAPALVEAKVVEWLRELMGFPAGSSGLLLSGGSMAGTTALAVARNRDAGWDVRAEGLQGERPLLTVYGSTETHSWAGRAVELLGLGRRSLRCVPCRADFTMDVAALRRALAEDRAAGLRPVAVLGTAGTVNTGATDDLEALADLCAEERLWLHVDGAFGALAALSRKLRPRVRGLERADSLGFDLHKWMYLPFEIACLLVRDGEAHRAAFAQTASYISALDRGTIAGGLPFADLGVELTRGFKALKAWMALKAYGVDAFARLIEQNVEGAQYLAERVAAEPRLELKAPVPLNVVCFRHRGSDELNREILLQLQERGLAVPSSTVLDGAFCLRVCLVNHRTRRSDLDDLVRDVLELGAGGGEERSGRLA